MARPKINGSTDAVRKQLRISYDPQKGTTTTQEYHSAGDNLNGVANMAKIAGQSFEHVVNGRLSTITVKTVGEIAGPNREQGTTTWQLFTNEYQKDILQSPAAIALGPGQLAQIGRDVEEIKNGGQDAYDTILSDAYYNDTPNAFALATYLLAGLNSYEIIFYTARVAHSMPFLYAGAVPGVAPDSLMGNLMSAIAVGGPNDGTLYKWGWRRLGTSRTFQGNNRTEISIEWKLGVWPALVYPDITALPE